ncbi:MAG: histidine phosphatase family protein [Alphaproteobacteria bacterium]|nr:histidine phosphatase family protein [Alphaproteobacteria bacterium]
MTTTFYLIRHGLHDLLGRVLVGRMEGVPLNCSGREQAMRLARSFIGRSLALLQSSPCERARQTAAPIAETLHLPLEIAPEVDEVDVGEWTGSPFESLAADPRWKSWNEARQSARAPGGESMREVRDRVIRHLDRLGSRYPNRHVGIVSHADVIKVAVLHHLGLSLDAFDRIEIDASSITALAIGDWGAKLLALNHTAAA